MKLAFLFLTVDNHHQPEVWRAFFDSAQAPDYSIYCHPKFPERVTQPWLQSNIIAEHCDTQHGDISLVRAQLKLLHAAFADVDNEYFILLSESCVPLYGFALLQQQLAERGMSWIAYGFDVRRENMARWRQLQPGFVGLAGFRKQHQWVVLKRDAVAILQQHDYTPIFELMYAADEHYIVNVLVKCGMTLETHVCNAAPTFVNWEDYEVTKDGASVVKLRPRTYEALTVEDVLYARSNDCLFLRKVSVACDCQALYAADEPWGPPRLPVVSTSAPRPFFSVIVLDSYLPTLGLSPSSMEVGTGPPLDVEYLVAGESLPPSAHVTGGINVYDRVNGALLGATGHWIHILPVGHQVTPDFYPRMRADLEALPPSVGVAFCRFSIMTEGKPFTPAAEGDEPGILDEDWLAGLVDANPLQMSAVLIRRDIFETLGLFHADLPYCADWEMYIRTAISHRWWYQPQRMVTVPVGSLPDDVEGRAEQDVRSTHMRAAIHFHDAHPKLPLPWGLRAESSNFMMSEGPDGNP